MKPPLLYILAPSNEQIGKGAKDFSFTEEGEPLTLSMTCSSGFPGDSCGCRRCFSGIDSRKGTTIGIVGYIEGSAQSLASRDLIGFGISNPSKDSIKNTVAEILMISKLISKYPVGTRICIAVDGEATTMERAGEISDEWGI